MQQQIVDHKEKSSTSNQVVEKSRDRRFAKSMVVAISCETIRLDNEEKETYKVQSASDTNKYYIVKFMDRTLVFCSCKDFEIQVKNNEKHLCKHVRAIVLAENYELIKKVVVTKHQCRTKLQNNILKESVLKREHKVIEESSISNDNDDEEYGSSDSSYCQSQNNAAKFEEARVEPKSYQDDEYSF